jgi:uncharacterized protein (DUF2237 family)
MNERTDDKNVLGGPLADCSKDPITGWFRDGCCRTDERDHGVHTVCVEVTETFLTFSRAEGNDLSTPAPQFDFPGLKPGDQWCLCAARWLHAYQEKAAPKVRLSATHERTLEIVPLDALLDHAIDAH